MKNNFDNFAKQIEAAKKKIDESFKEFKQAVVSTVFSYVNINSAETSYQFGSPVLTGRYLSSHIISDGMLDRSAPPAGLNDYPQKDASYAKSKIASIKPYDITYIASNVPYARKLEEGFSLKAPGGIYTIAVSLTKVEFKPSSNKSRRKL
jgi:hypothetical protein